MTPKKTIKYRVERRRDDRGWVPFRSTKHPGGQVFDNFTAAASLWDLIVKRGADRRDFRVAAVQVELER